MGEKTINEQKMSSKRKNAFDDNCKTSVDFEMLRVIYERGYKFYSLL